MHILSFCHFTFIQSGKESSKKPIHFLHLFTFPNSSQCFLSFFCVWKQCHTSPICLFVYVCLFGLVLICVPGLGGGEESRKEGRVQREQQKEMVEAEAAAAEAVGRWCCRVEGLHVLCFLDLCWIMCCVVLCCVSLYPTHILSNHMKCTVSFFRFILSVHVLKIWNLWIQMTKCSYFYSYYIIIYSPITPFTSLNSRVYDFLWTFFSTLLHHYFIYTLFPWHRILLEIIDMPPSIPHYIHKHYLTS